MRGHIHESPETIEIQQDYVIKKKLPVQMFFKCTDCMDVLASDGIPATYIVDRQGRIVFSHVGAALWDDESVINFLTELVENDS